MSSSPSFSPVPVERPSESEASGVLRILDPDHPGQLLAGLNACRQRALFTDVRLCLGQEEIPCHRVVLAASSPYFEAMFAGDFREQSDACVVIEEVSPWVMRRLLDFLYTGELTLSTEDAQDLLGACHLLGYGRLVEHCCRFMARHLDPGNCLRLELLASLYGLAELREAAHACAERHFAELVATPDFLDAPLDQLLSYLDSDAVDVPSEDFMWSACRAWVAHEPEARRDALPMLLARLRWAHMSGEASRRAREHSLVASSASLRALVDRVVGEQADRPPAPRRLTVPTDTLVALGGINAFILNCAQRYDAKRDRWSALAPMPASPTYFSAGVIANEVFVTGGIVNSRIVATVHRYSPRRNAWAPAAAMLTPRARHASVTTEGRLFVMGGITLSAPENEVARVEAIESYDPGEDQWTRVGVCPCPSLESSLVALWTGASLSPEDPHWMLVEVGGAVGLSGEEEPVDGGRGGYGSGKVLPCYRVADDGREVRSENQHFLLPERLRRGRAVACANRLYILWEETGRFMLLDMESSMRRFRWLPMLPRPRLNCAMCLIDDRICVMGGHVAEHKPCDWLDWFDLETLTWTEGVSSGLPRACHGCVCVRM